MAAMCAARAVPTPTVAARPSSSSSSSSPSSSISSSSSASPHLRHTAPTSRAALAPFRVRAAAGSAAGRLLYC